MKKLLFITLLLFVNFSFSQNVIKVRKSKSTDTSVREILDTTFNFDDRVYTFAELTPQFPGGQQKLFEFLNRQIKYPDSLKKVELSGRVYVQFIIEKDGSVTNPIIIRSTHFLFSKEVLRIIKKMPKWIPAEQNGKKIRLRYSLSVNFKLD